MKEFGGFLPIELRHGKQYYEKNAVALNAARYAILLSLKAVGGGTVYIPYYLCNSVKETLVLNGIQVKEYNINETFFPDSIEDKNTPIVLVNYFGVLSRSKIKRVIKSYKNVIVDNTQAFFCKPFENAYTIYSCRKFFGVSDGAYLWKKNIDMNLISALNDDYSTNRSCIHLMSSLERGTNYAYETYLQCEEALSNVGVLKMYKLTSSVLANIDYKAISQIRMANFSYLSMRLNRYNELGMFCKNGKPAMVYPLLVKRDGLRQKLIEHKIYVPQWWKKCLCDGGTNNFERELSEYLLPLPIDQRYTLADMEELANIIINLLEE